jgi:hypothetical protein
MILLQLHWTYYLLIVVGFIILVFAGFLIFLSWLAGGKRNSTDDYDDTDKMYW